LIRILWLAGRWLPLDCQPGLQLLSPALLDPLGRRRATPRSGLLQAASRAITRLIVRWTSTRPCRRREPLPPVAHSTALCCGKDG